MTERNPKIHQQKSSDLRSNKPLFITFEGGEGAGKTTLINKVEGWMRAEGLEVVRTREPGGTRLSEHIRNWLLNKDFEVAVGHKAELLLFLAARAQHLEELIQPALDAGKNVLCDRFNDSTVVYQGIARGLGVQLTQDLCNLVCGPVTPDLTLFLDLDPKVGLARTAKLSKENAAAGQTDRIESEKIEFHEAVRKGFLTLASQYPKRFRVIDASANEEAVFNQALLFIREKMRNG